MDDIIERLREEKMQIEAEYFDSGSHTGKKWCETANYLEMAIVMEWDGKRLPYHYIIEDFLFDVDTFKYDLIDFEFEGDEFFKFNDFGRKYFDGFIESVSKIWRLI